ncbi:MAG: sigma-70 family RNA polymerase sigma factor [Defluviitaleaceae bacterium]|nr:sigma-70 family RNA polymerase sigma factor [Defluviitaleaceae bacterium]
MGKTNARIADAAKSIYTYCRSRTNTKEEAEDLSQDILVELLKSQGSLRDEKAFYGFMWAVAGNVCKNWYKKRHSTCELNDNVTDTASFTEMLEKESDIRALHRELKLLPEQYRKVVVMYYFDGMKVAAISKALNISESMVKFLLFKGRKILKEGIKMERTFGDFSFNPARMTLRFFAPDEHWPQCVEPTYFERNIIAQNILLTCYNEPCTAEEISLQLGISVPYLEKDLQELCDAGVLKKNPYETDIVIFTKEFSEEALAKTAAHQKEIADILTNFLDTNLSDFKKIGFFTGDPGDDSLLRWRIAHLILEQAVINANTPTPATNGILYWGSEGEKYSCLAANYDNEAGDKLNFLEFLPGSWLKPYSWGHFWNRDDRVKLLLEIAARQVRQAHIENLSKATHALEAGEKIEVAELIKLGFLKKDGDKITPCIPVYTAAQFNQALALTTGATEKIAKITAEAVEMSADILVQHAPASKKAEAKSVAWLKNRELAMDRPVEIMLGSGALRRTYENEHPAVYAVV